MAETAPGAPLPAPLVHILEDSEARAAEDFVRFAPPAVAAALGVRLERIDDTMAFFAPAVDDLTLNRAVGFGMSPAAPAREETLDRLVALLRTLAPRRYFVQVSPHARAADGPGGGNPGDGAIAGWLAGRGFRRHNRWMKLWRNPDTPLPAALLTPAWRVDAIGPREAADFARIDGRGFNMPESVWPWTAAAVGQPDWRHYVARDGEVPIATGAMLVRGNWAWIGFAATLESFRGRGAQAALIARRIVDARALGVRWIVAETAEDRPDRPAPSYRNLRRFGFQDAYARDNWLWFRDGG